MDAPLPNDADATLVRHFFAEQDAGNLAIIDRLTADGFELHAAGVPGPLDRDGMRGFAESFYAAFPDLTHSFSRQVSYGGLVASHARLRGTHTGSFQGVEATGTTVDVDAMMFTRVDGGRVARHWTVVDQLGLLAQLGAVHG